MLATWFPKKEGTRDGTKLESVALALRANAAADQGTVEHSVLTYIPEILFSPYIGLVTTKNIYFHYL